MPTKDLYGLEPLLQRALAGDGRAFNELLAGLRLYMHKQVRKQLGDRPDRRINQSDIVFSVCRRFIIHFPELEDPSVPLMLGWVAKVVRNRVLDELRRIAREPRLLGSAVLSLRDPRPTAESRARAERAAAVAAALARLPAREQRVVESQWFDHQPDAATAQELGISVSYVRLLRFRALVKLRKLLEHTLEANR
jgi:RNA polymerase sigma-70 factor (ECF subfamily)